jgi:hypothetical protein
MNTNTIKRELVKISLKTVKRIGKDFSWLKFARKTGNSYRFLSNRERQWEVLQEIAKIAVRKYPKYREGEVVDILSDLVNER